MSKSSKEDDEEESQQDNNNKYDDVEARRDWTVNEQEDDEEEQPPPSLERAVDWTKEASVRLQRAVVEGTKSTQRVVVERTKSTQRAVVEGTRSLSLSTQAAAAVATATVVHTVHQIGSHPLESSATTARDDEEGEAAASGEAIVKGEENDKYVTRVNEKGVFAVAIVGFFASLWSFFAVMARLVNLSSLTVLILAPTAYYQKKKLRKLGSLRQLQNELRSTTSRLSTENAQLTESIDHLSTHLERLNTVETQLTHVADDAQQSVEKLVLVVDEHAALQAKLKRVLMDDIVHQLFSALLQSDRDGNYKLSAPDETRHLEQRLENVQGVIFSKKNFRRLVQSSDGTDDLTLTDAANLARELQLDDDIPDQDKVFIFRPLDILPNQQTSASTTTASSSS